MPRRRPTAHFLIALFSTTLTLSLTAPTAASQTLQLHATAGKDAQQVTSGRGVPALRQATVALPIQLTATAPHGEVWLEVSAQNTLTPSPRLTLRLPLSSTEDVYGESRSCTVAPGGAISLIFTAGMDEANFVPFAPAARPTQIRLPLNKYLCRAMAAPFQCNGHALSVAGDWAHWQLGNSTKLVLTGDAPASLAAAPAKIEAGEKAFDPASCAVIAPSNGMCCVAHQATQWHCGGTPTGEGWHQVSGDCFHRETGATCSQGTPLEMPIELPR